jgi:hypothetical protein
MESAVHLTLKHQPESQRNSLIGTLNVILER